MKKLGKGSREEAMQTGFMLNFHIDMLILMFILKSNLARIARENQYKNRVIRRD